MADLYGVGVVLIRNKKILLGFQYRSYEEPCWATPGGKVDPTEKILETAQREVLEETGIKINDADLLTIYEDKEKTRKVVSFQMIAKDFTGKAVVKEKKKAREWKWFNKADIPKNLSLNTSRILKHHKVKKELSD